MQELWREMSDFAGYQVSNFGRVYSPYMDKVMAQQRLSNGVPGVWLSDNGKQHCRAVPLLVARLWLPEPEREDFISPIQLDGDRMNCHADNLLWRPRWFSINFHKERLQNPFPNWQEPIEVIQTNEIFRSPRSCSMKYGNLERDIYMGIANHTPVFPQHFHVRMA